MPLTLRLIGGLLNGSVGVVLASFAAWLGGGNFGLGAWWAYIAVFLAAALFIQFIWWLDARCRAWLERQKKK